jgi:hypothetical protein
MVRHHGLVPPFELEDKLKAARAGQTEASS